MNDNLRKLGVELEPLSYSFLLWVSTHAFPIYLPWLYNIEHRIATKHGNADGLSRIKCENCKQCNRIEKRDGGPSHSDIAATTQDRLMTEINRPLSSDITERPIVCVAQTTDLACLQQQKPSDLEKVYQCVKSQVILNEDELRMGSPELKRWTIWYHVWDWEVMVSLK